MKVEDNSANSLIRDMGVEYEFAEGLAEIFKSVLHCLSAPGKILPDTKSDTNGDNLMEFLEDGAGGQCWIQQRNKGSNGPK